MWSGTHRYKIQLYGPISADSASYFKRQLRSKVSWLNIEQKNPFIQNVKGTNTVKFGNMVS